MPNNMIVRVVADASNFSREMKKAEDTAQKTGQKIKKAMSMSELSAEASKIMGWGGADASGIKTVTAANVGTAMAQKQTLTSYRDMLADIGFEDSQVSEVTTRIKQLSAALDSYKQEALAAAQAVQATGNAAEASAGKLSWFQQAGQAMGNAFHSMGTAVQVVRSCGDAAEDSEDDLTGMQRAALRAKAALSSIGSAAKSGLSWLASLPKKLASGAWNGLKSLGSHLVNIGKKAASSSTGMGKMLSSIKKISIASLALNVAHSIFGRLKSIVSEYINENETLKAQTEALKSSMGQALAPAINLVTNAMSALMPYVVGISNAIGSLMASLMGNGWAAAADGAKKTAAATNGAAAAQEKMSKQLMGFDQINRMDGEKNSSGGGGGGATTAATIEPKVPAWLDTYKKAFSDTFESLEFQSASVGGKIGMALNTAVVTTVGLLKDVDFGSIGQSLAGHFNDAVGAIDWSAAGQLVGLALMALPLTIVGFISNADWALVGQSLTTFLTTSFDSVGEKIRSVDWVQIGQSIKTFIDNTDWGAITQSFGRTLGNALGAIGAVIWEVVREPWENFWNNCKDRADQCGGDMVSGVFLGILDALSDIGNWLWTNLGKPIIDGVKECFGIHSPSTVFAEIGEQLMNGLTGGISTGLAWVQEKLNTLKQKVLDAAEKLKSAFSFEWKLPSLKLPHLQLDWEPVDNVVAKFFGVTAFPHLSVSWFAKGGILDGAQIFGAVGSTLLGGGEAGREAILPLDSNTGWMDDLARKVASLVHSDGGAVSATINIVLDGKILTSYVIKDLRSRARAGSISLG